MAGIKKLKGGFKLFVTEDEKLIATSNSRNTVYVYDADTKKLVLQTKTVSNVSEKAISSDKKYLAAKNTGGLIALISMETGVELFRNKMEEREGYPMTFTSDNENVLDLDWNGNTMLWDCTDNTCKVLDRQEDPHSLPRVSYMHYDRHSNLIYKFVADEWGYSKGVVMASKADPENINFKIVQKFPDVLPDDIRGGISFCKEHNYYVDRKNKQIIMCDKQFKELKRIAIPEEAFQNDAYYISFLWASPNENYYFILTKKKLDRNNMSKNSPVSYLVKADTMEIVQKFDYEYVSDFTMIHDDTEFIIATWQGSFMGKA